MAQISPMRRNAHLIPKNLVKDFWKQLLKRLQPLLQKPSKTVDVTIPSKTVQKLSKTVDVTITEIFPGSVEPALSDISSKWYQFSALDKYLPTTSLREPLVNGAPVNQHKAHVLIRSFTSQHHLTDACQVDLMKLLNAFVSAPNLKPSANKLLKSVKEILESSISNTINH